MFAFSLKNINKLIVIRNAVTKLHTTTLDFAGHSKWANIKHTKGLKDWQKSMQFQRLGRQIRLAAQAAGTNNPALSTPLRQAIDEALKKSMPSSTIQGILKKFDKNAAKLEKYFLELQQFSRIQIVCILYTDSFVRVKSDIGQILKKHFAKFSDNLKLFEETGIVEAIIPTDLNAEQDLLSICTEHAIECGIEDVEILDEANKIVNFICNPIEIDRVVRQLREKNYAIENSQHVFIPTKTIKLNDRDREMYEKLVGKLRAIEGVEDIFDNIEED